MNEIVIIDAIRTPLGKRKGWLREQHPVKLGAHVVRALLQRNGLGVKQVDHLVFGCVSQVGEQTMNVARNIGLEAELPIEAPGTSIDFQCGSSQQAIHLALGMAGHAASRSADRGRRREHDARADGLEPGGGRRLALHRQDHGKRIT